MNLRDHTLAWLESIGADGLMIKDGPAWAKERIDDANDSTCWDVLVPAYLHADGTYHAEKEPDGRPCINCPGTCQHGAKDCESFKRWLSHKEAK